MKKRISKKWIAIFCALLLLPWSVMLDGLNSVFAGGSITDPNTLETWTIETVGLGEEIECNATNHTFAGTATGETLDGKVFKAQVRFATVAANLTDTPNGTEYTRMILGSGVGDQGFILQGICDGNLQFSYYNGSQEIAKTTITPESVGSDVALTDQILNLMVTTEFVNSNGVTTDVNVGVYVNGKLYGEQYIEVQGATIGLLSQNLTGNNWGKMSETMWIGMPVAEEESTPITNPDDLETWTIETVGLGEGVECNPTNYTFAGTPTGENLDGKVFKAQVKFATSAGNLTEISPGVTEYTRMILGSGVGDQGFILQGICNGNLVFSYYDGSQEIAKTTITPESVGSDAALTDQILDLMVTTEFVNSNGVTTDVNVGVYVNGKLYGEQYIKVTGASAALLTQNLSGNNYGDITETMWIGMPVVEEESTPVTNPDDLENWTLATVGLPEEVECNTTTHSFTGTPTGEELNGKVFSTMVQFVNSAANLTGGEYTRIILGSGIGDQGLII